MKKIMAALVSAIIAISFTVSAVPVSAASGVLMMRLYNDVTGEHFYTKNVGERNDLVVRGWTYEGVGWTAPTSGAPVFRLYNPNTGDHHYTTNKGEKDSLQRCGWRFEGIGWYSDTRKAVPLYRIYNPNARTGSHNYTTSQNERNSLMKSGWRYEGVGWYGLRTERGSYYEDGMFWTEVHKISEAYLLQNYLIVRGPFRFVNSRDEYSGGDDLTYIFPITSATLFYETDSGEGGPGDATIMSASQAVYNVSHHVTGTGPAMEITIRNGYVESVRFGA